MTFVFWIMAILWTACLASIANSLTELRKELKEKRKNDARANGCKDVGNGVGGKGMSEYIFLPLHEKRELSEKADHNYNASIIDMIGEGRLYIIFGGLRAVKETREQILGLYEKMSNGEERLKLRKKVEWQAEKKGLPLSSLVLSHGFLQYPPERVLLGMEKIPVDERRNIYLYRIPESGKWCQGADWVPWSNRDIYHYIPSPVWGEVYETREEALTAAWKFLGVERKAIQLDLFGGDYS